MTSLQHYKKKKKIKNVEEGQFMYLILKKTISNGTTKLSEVEATIAKVEKATYNDEYVDIVFSTYSCHHIIEKRKKLNLNIDYIIPNGAYNAVKIASLTIEPILNFIKDLYIIEKDVINGKKPSQYSYYYSYFTDSEDIKHARMKELKKQYARLKHEINNLPTVI